jgi:uncharacterized UPF0160 family protein
MSNINIITHSGGFHADDVCAVATLSILYKDKISVIRTRDSEVIKTGDIILDVGGLSDGERFFDHHQEGGAGKRENGIPYASFGLIWKKFGGEIVKNQNVFEKIDRVLVQPIDAIDNGVKITESIFEDVSMLSINSIVQSFNPTWDDENKDYDSMFLQAVEHFKLIISRIIKFHESEDLAKSHVINSYQSAEDKRIIVLDKEFPFQETLMSFKEPLFAIYMSPQSLTWHVKAISKEKHSFLNRMNFPTGWAGKSDKELQKITGVQDAVFCHNKLFLAVAGSKEGAVKLAELAISNNI